MPEAYVGIIYVECVNPKCAHFSEKLLNEKIEAGEDELSSTLSFFGITREDLLEALSDDYYAYVDDSTSP